MKVKSIPQVTEITLRYKPKRNSNKVIQDSAQAFTEMKSFFDKNTIGVQEEFLVMYLNRNNMILGICRHSKGGLTGTVADIRLILATALQAAACSIIVAHNHPSGNLKASQADIDISNRLKDSAAIMDIQLLDHLIVSPTWEYLSMAEQRLIAK